MVDGLVLQGADAAEQAVRVAWRGSVAVVGADGLPPSADAGAVLRPFTTLKLVVRLPPTADPEAAGEAVARALTADPPYGATVEWDAGMVAGGWSAPPLEPWLVTALDAASTACFAIPPAGWEREGPSRSWAGWPASSPMRRSWPSACSAPAPTPTAPTRDSTCPRPSGSPRSLALLWMPMPPGGPGR